MFLSNNEGSHNDQAKNIINQSIDLIISEYEAQIAKLKARADDSIPVIKTDIGQCDKITGDLYCDISRYEDCRNSYYSSKRSPDEVFKYVSDLLDGKIKLIEELHAKNIPSIENNKIVREKLEKLLKSIGIPDSIRERDTKSRARFPKYISISAGYKKDIASIVISDGYESTLDSVKRKREQLKTWVDTKKLVVQKEKEEKEKKELEVKRIRQFGMIASRYGLTENDTENDLLDKILEKDKYLRLGHYLLKNREDWNDGYSYAECGLGGFNIESEEDKLIAADIQEAINNWDGDGRVFRDGYGSYDHCFSLIKDEQLYKDYQLVKSWTDK